MSDDKDERIKTRAYQIWEEEGRPDGRHDEHWHRAVQESGTAPPYPEMMGDETEEQNLDQPGDPSARIGKDEVEEAFGADPIAGPGKAER